MTARYANAALSGCVPLFPILQPRGLMREALRRRRSRPALSPSEPASQRAQRSGAPVLPVNRGLSKSNRFAVASSSVSRARRLCRLRNSRRIPRSSFVLTIAISPFLASARAPRRDHPNGAFVLGGDQHESSSNAPDCLAPHLAVLLTRPIVRYDLRVGEDCNRLAKPNPVFSWFRSRLGIVPI